MAHLNDQLKLNIKELEQSNKELDNITYIASHDLKSPLRGISLLSQWLSHELEGQVSPSVLDKIQTLGQRVNKMESILERMLSYSDVGKKAYELKSVDSRALCHHLFNQAKQHQDNSLILTGEFPVFTTYKTPFEQVLRHLIENAIKHNPSKQAQFTLEVAEQDGYYHFKLSDNGPGMSPLLVSAIDDESEFNEPLDMANIGIGLNMVKKVIKQYDGKLTIILSNDRGTSVLFTWPVRPNALTPL